ncbi:MAG TPA: TonB-dependent receptor, partial [Bryobacteraceae bacterium]|nr:TonB-dependent receptor [Bryobacteraceae bacterium]
ADVGTGAGAHIELTSRRGGDVWHGGVFEQARRAYDGLRGDQFGGSAGGPLMPNRVFLFAHAERARHTAEMRRTEIVPGAPAAEQFWRAPAREHAYDGRIDIRASDGNVLFARYSWRKAALGGRDETTSDAASDITVAWTASRGGASSELRAGFRRTPISSWRTSNTAYRIAETGSTMIRLPGGDGPGSFDYRPRAWSLREDLSWGSWRAGAELRAVRVPIRQLARAVYSFASVADYVQDQRSSVSYFGDIQDKTGAQELYAAYVQREWRVRSSLLLNTGLRYELYTANRELHGGGRVFDAALLDYAGGPFYTVEKLGFAPRAAVAWSVAAGTVIRAGAGVHYGPGSYRNLMQPIDNVSARVQISDGRAVEVPSGVDVKNYRIPERDFQFGASLEQQLPARFVAQAAYFGGHGRHLLLESVANPITAVDPFTGALTRQNPRYGEIPLTTSGGDNLYNSLQSQLRRRFSNSLALTASHTWAVLRGHSADAVQDPRCLMCERSPDAFDIRHSVAAAAAYSWRGWTFDGMFTARSGLPVNVLVDRPDRIRDANGRWILSTPGGGAHRTAQRPDLAAGVNPYLRKGREWLNPAAFAMPAPGAYGNLPRNALRGPGFAQIDVSIARTLHITERIALELRGAVYNLAGRVNYRNPTNVLPHAGFGYLADPIVQAGALTTGRDGELSVRFAF